MFTTILLLFIFIILIYNYYVLYGKNGRIINLIPGPSGYPIVGNVFQFLGSQEDIWNVLISFSNQYYPIYKSWLSFIPIVLIRHPDDLETILSSRKHIEKSNIMYDLAKPWLGTGLLISKSDKWHSRRKILTPTFHFKILEQFVEIFIKEGENMTQSLKCSEETVVNDLISFCSEYTLNAICETAMGFSLQDLNEFQQQYRKMVHEIMNLFVYRPWLYFDWIFSWTSKGKQQAEIVKILHEFTERIIAERKLYHERTNGQYLRNWSILDSDISAEKDDTGTIRTRRKKLAMLDLLIAISREGLMNDSDIREEIDVFVFGGHDTVATTLSYILMLLAEHKDIQDRVRTEIDTVMQENGKFTMQSLQQLSYLDRCIKEAMRLYPSGPFISRVCGEDVKLQSYLIPVETILFIDIYGVHRDPNFWPNPKKFDPDRFLPEKIQNQHPYSYIPFSAGPRNCIGQKFAMLEMKAMLSSLLHNFYLEPIDYLRNIRLQYNLMLHPVHPFRIRFVPICKIKSTSI